ncbi:hypothetical protein [Brevibacillus borstelensis]|uniref:hypothetical protein n=1 Tax=Brevibacillus borstelensis TaxID=45462 RepID=UPI0030C0CB8A
MKWKWLLALIAVCLGAVSAPAAAEGIYDITVNVPLDGIVKYDSWMRLEVAVTSRDQPFSGTVELRKDAYRQKTRNVVLKQPLTLQEGEKKKVVFDLPAEMMMNDWKLQLVENGRTVKSEKVRLPYPRDGIIIGVLHSGDSAFHFLAMNQSGPGSGGPYLVYNMTPESMPDVSWLYNNLDILALGGKDISTLGDRQVEAIKLWVKQGGILILSAGSDQQKLLDQFSDFLPLKSREQGKIIATEGLRPYLLEKNIPAFDIPVYDKHQPLFVSRKTGEGLFLFVNYDVTQEPLASWQFNAQLWQSVFQHHGVQNLLTNTGYFDQLGRPSLELSRQIPQVRTPDPIMMAGLWVLYAFIVAPGLYWLLKRKDKRQWAWGIIPGAAILLSTGIFYLGKPMVVSEDVSYAVTKVRLLDKQTAEATTASSFLVVGGGNFDIDVKPGTVAVPLSVGRNDYQPDGMIGEGSDGSLLSFQNVPYLTPRQTVGFGMLQDTGQIENHLQVQGDRIIGSIKNDTMFSFDQSYLEVGLQRIPLGSLQKGEGKNIDVKLESLYIPRKPFAEEEETPARRVRRMQDDVLAYGGDKAIRIKGVNQDPLSPFALKLPHREHHWNVITQNVQLEPDASGHITFPFGMLRVDIHEVKGDFDSNSAGLWELSKGSVIFSLKLGEAFQTADQLTVPLDHSMFRPFEKEVFHQKSGKWMALPRGKRLVVGKELREYLTPDGSILIRFSNPGEQRLALPMPYFQVEGKERKKHD